MLGKPRFISVEIDPFFEGGSVMHSITTTIVKQWIGN